MKLLGLCGHFQTHTHPRSSSTGCFCLLPEGLMPAGVRTPSLVSRFMTEGASFWGQLSPGLLGWQLHFLAPRAGTALAAGAGAWRPWEGLLSYATVGTAMASAGRAAGLPPAPELQASRFCCVAEMPLLALVLHAPRLPACGPCSHARGRLGSPGLKLHHLASESLLLCAQSECWSACRAGGHTRQVTRWGQTCQESRAVFEHECAQLTFLR